MRIELQDSFIRKLNRQVDFIAHDKPSAARNFKNTIISKLKELIDFPFKSRKSIFFEDESIRDMIYQGYICVYKVDTKNAVIRVFGFVKYQKSI